MVVPFPSKSDVITSLSSPKLVVSTGWRQTPRQNSLRIMCGLTEQNGTSMKGLTFSMTANANRPDECVTAVLLIETPNRPMCCARFDWRGSPHPNASSLCGDMQYIPAGRSHWHDPALYPDDATLEKAMMQNLPAAVSSEPEPSDFSDLLTRCARLFRIENLTDLQVPPWQSRPIF